MFKLEALVRMHISAKRTRTHRTTSLIISFNIHFVPLADIKRYKYTSGQDFLHKKKFKRRQGIKQLYRFHSVFFFGSHSNCLLFTVCLSLSKVSPRQFIVYSTMFWSRYTAYITLKLLSRKAFVSLRL